MSRVTREAQLAHQTLLDLSIGHMRSLPADLSYSGLGCRVGLSSSPIAAVQQVGVVGMTQSSQNHRNPAKGG